MKTIEATATREGKWWAVDFTVNGREFSTQAKTLKGVTYMVKDVCAMLNEPNVEVNVTPRTGCANAIEEYRLAAEVATKARRDQGVMARRAANALRDESMTVRDIAALMNVTPARVSQLLASR